MNESDVVTLFLRITVVISMAGVIAWALRRRSPASRYTTWLLALGACIELVVIAPVVPSTRWPVSILSVAPATETKLPAAVADGRAAGSTVLSAQPATPATSGQLTSSFSPGNNGENPKDSSFWIIACWILGAVLVLAYRAAGSLSAAILIRKARPCENSEWTSLLAEIACRLGIEKPPALLMSSEVSGPAVTGLIRQTIILPHGSSSWSDSHQRAALLHELAHVERRDPWGRMVATIACALCWFHPGVWIAARQLTRESEAACDDIVLTAGAEETEYASQLLELARSALHQKSALKGLIAMARQPHIQSRIRRILDPESVRTRPGRRLRNVAIVLAATTAAGIASVKPVAAHPAFDSALNDSTRKSAAKSISGPDTSYVQSIAAENAGALSLNLATAADVHVTGWDQNDVELRAYLKGFESVAMPRLVRSDSGIGFVLDRMNGNDLSGHKYRFEFRVPRRFDVSVIGRGGGELEVSNISGAVNGSKGAGPVTLSRISGGVTATTGNGDVAIDSASSGDHFKTSRGSITVAAASGRIQAETSKGDVNVGFTPNFAPTGESRIATANGDIVLDIPSGMSATFQLEGEIGRTSTTVDSKWPVRLDTVTVFNRARNRNLRLVRGTMSIGRGSDPIHVAASAGRIVLRQSPDTR